MSYSQYEEEDQPLPEVLEILNEYHNKVGDWIPANDYYLIGKH